MNALELLPTPQSDSNKLQDRNKRVNALELLPTPQSDSNKLQDRNKRVNALELLPTPQVSAHRDKSWSKVGELLFMNFVRNLGPILWETLALEPELNVHLNYKTLPTDRLRRKRLS